MLAVKNILNVIQFNGGRMMEVSLSKSETVANGGQCLLKDSKRERGSKEKRFKKMFKDAYEFYKNKITET